MHHIRVSTLHVLPRSTGRYATSWQVSTRSRSRSTLDAPRSKLPTPSQTHPKHSNNMCAHNATHNSRTSTRHCHALDLRHFAGARSAARAFLAQYSSSTRRTRRVVLPAMCCTHVESDVRIDFPTPSRVGRMPTSQATIECLHCRQHRSRRTSQLTRARNVPYSCEYIARVATQHTQLCYESVGEHTIAISIRHSTHHATNSSRRHKHTQNTSTTCAHTMPRTIRVRAHATATHSTDVTLLARDRRHARFSLDTHLPLVARVSL